MSKNTEHEGVPCVVIKFYTRDGEITTDATHAKTFIFENVCPWHSTVYVQMRICTKIYGSIERLDHRFELQLAPTAKVSLSKGDGEVYAFSAITQLYYFDEVKDDGATTTLLDSPSSLNLVKSPLRHPDPSVNVVFIEHPNREPNFDLLLVDAIKSGNNVVIAVDGATAQAAYYFYETIRSGKYVMRSPNLDLVQVDAIEDRRIMIYHYPFNDSGYMTYFPYDMQPDLFLRITNLLNDSL